MVVKTSAMNADEFELHAVGLLCGSSDASDGGVKFLKLVLKRVSDEVGSCDTTSASSMRSHLSPWWRVLGTAIETAVCVLQLSSSQSLFKHIHDGFQSLKSSLDSVISSAGLDPNARDTLSVYGGFNLAYTSAVRAALESVHVLMDPLLGCELLLGLEATLPMDNKGICNVYKRVRQMDDNFTREAIASLSADASMDTFPEGDVVLEDVSKSFEKFWTMMDVSRRCEPELLTETKSWGKFSQSATATLNLLMEQPEGLDAAGFCSKEPIEYEAKLTSFPIQLSSASFRRRALLNILFTCSYVAQNSPNALVTAGAKSLYSTVLKSAPTDLGVALSLLAKFENHWVAWKSTAHSKEVCGPFERRSRIERGLTPFGEPILDLASISTPPAEPMELGAHPAVTKIGAILTSDALLGSAPKMLHKAALEQKLAEYRKHVADAILCDISDEAELARLSANDQGMEEAMRINNDRVLLWQFKRMRFNTDLKSFEPSAETPADPAMDQAEQEETPTSQENE